MKRNLLEKIIKLIKEQPTNATGTAVPGTGDDSSTVVVKKKKLIQGFCHVIDTPWACWMQNFFFKTSPVWLRDLDF